MTTIQTRRDSDEDGDGDGGLGTRWRGDSDNSSEERLTSEQQQQHRGQVRGNSIIGAGRSSAEQGMGGIHRTFEVTQTRSDAWSPSGREHV